MRILFLGVAIVATSALGQNLYKLNGKVFQRSDLPAAINQNLFEAESKHRDEIQNLVEEAIFSNFLEEQSKKMKKPVPEVVAQLLKVKDPTDKELKEFYDKNKARISTPFDQVKAQLIDYLKMEKTQKVKADLIAEQKKKGKFEFLVPTAESPVVQINTLGAPIKGTKGAKVKIVEFADYQCPHCAHAHEVLGKVMKKYSAKVEFSYLDFPINRSGISKRVAEGAFCANKQGKFWEFHDLAFTKQTELTAEKPAEFAKNLKLDETAFKKCLDSQEAKDFVQNSMNEGERIGIQGTPSIYMNGKKLLSWDEETLAKEIDQASR